MARWPRNEIHLHIRTSCVARSGKRLHAAVGPGGNIRSRPARMACCSSTRWSSRWPRESPPKWKKLSSLPIRYIVDTSIDPDHLAGNAALAAMGTTGATQVPRGGATVITRGCGESHGAPAKPGETPAAGARPSESRKYFTRRRGSSHFNGEPVIIFHESKAHTDGDSIVLVLRRSECRQHRRHLHARSLSGDRPRQGRQRAGSTRRSEPRASADGSRTATGKAARGSFQGMAGCATKPTSSSAATW